MRPHSTGHTSMTGRSQMTMPPEWMPRCRGKSSTCAGQLQHVGGDVVVGGAVGPCWAAVTSTRPQASTCFDQASCWPGANPRALAMSRTAERAR